MKALAAAVAILLLAASSALAETEGGTPPYKQGLLRAENLRLRAYSEKMDYLYGTGKWEDALQTCGGLWKGKPCRNNPMEKSAFEMEKSIRLDYGNVFGAEAVRDSFGDDAAARFRMYTRNFVTKRTAVSLDWEHSLYKPGSVAAPQADRNIDGGGLVIFFDRRPKCGYRILLRSYSGSDNRVGYGGEQIFYPSKSTEIRLKYMKNSEWSDSVIAAVRGGRYDDVHVSADVTLKRNMRVHSEIERRYYSLDSAGIFGRDTRGALNVARTILNNSEHPERSLRYVEITAGYEASHSSQDAGSAAAITLTDRVSMITVGVDAHLLFWCSGSLDLGVFAGQDYARNLQLFNGDLYGFSLASDINVTGNAVLYLKSNFSTENAYSASSGDYWTTTLGLKYNY